MQPVTAPKQSTTASIQLVTAPIQTVMATIQPAKTTFVQPATAPATTWSRGRGVVRVMRSRCRGVAVSRGRDFVRLRGRGVARSQGHEVARLHRRENVRSRCREVAGSRGREIASSRARDEVCGERTLRVPSWAGPSIRGRISGFLSNYITAMVFQFSVGLRPYNYTVLASIGGVAAEIDRK